MPYQLGPDALIVPYQLGSDALIVPDQLGSDALVVPGQLGSGLPQFLAQSGPDISPKVSDLLFEAGITR